MNFEYFDYGEERRFSFLQVPKLLLTEERYRKLSGDAKLLYSLMLDRGSLSRQNKWYDERGHPFIYFTQDDITDSLGIYKEIRILLNGQSVVKMGYVYFVEMKAHLKKITVDHSLKRIILSHWLKGDLTRYIMWRPYARIVTGKCIIPEMKTISMICNS